MIDLSSVESVNENLPPGGYAAIISSTEFKPTKTGGEMLEVVYTITGPTHMGRKVWDRFNTKNTNPQAVNIGLSKLKSMALATGLTVEKLKNFHPELIFNRELGIETIIKSDPTYGERVEVKKYMPNTNAPRNSTDSTTEIPF